MSSEHYSRVIQEWCSATGMQTWSEHNDMHVEINDTLVGLINGGETNPDSIQIYIDLGHFEIPELHRTLLEKNITSDLSTQGFFGLHPLTNSIVYRTSMHLTSETNGASLPRVLNQLIHTVRDQLEISLLN